ncbi:hypothetical protein G1K46_08750 [Tenacibaculum finnmarkense]|uniref:AHH domain-containing protein n=1 Tax=Tenacibaculum finnmarkense TaxID=2781243 RepID=UPI001EFA6149|nr:AHH domain-containing protein [Tenacibaculum finnmarkense]MCG8762818.1 hypothetical protein [Tenacibaculum finnmarkense]MCG8788195.1 hypothetical protein [Tenacibaculum finnmarkense]
MKKIQSNFILLAFICITINIFGQRSNFPIEHQRNRNGEFIERRPDDFDDIRNATKRCCENPNNTELGDFSFSWGNGSFNNLLANDRLVKEAARRRLNNWYNRQVNEIIKPAIEYRYNKKFANFEDAKNYLFKISEENKSYVNLPKTTNKYANLKSKGQSKEKGHLMSLKLLSFREKEIRNGKINNSFYGDKKINGVLLKNIRSVNAVKTLWDTQVDLFTKNTIIYNNNKNILHKLRNLDSDFYKEATRQKNNYYNTFSAWDKLNFMQVLINYDEYDAKKLRPDANLLFFEFENIIISTPEFIENYAIKHSEKYNSIFTNNCLSYYRIFGWKGYKTKSKRDHECEKAKLAELDKKINETSIGSNLSVDFLVDYTGLITGKYQLQWLNDNPEKANIYDNAIMSMIMNSGQMVGLSLFKTNILPIIDKGALTSKLIEELGITSYQDSKKRHFLYNNQTEADELIKFANENKVNGKITSKALAYIKGQVELETLIQNSRRNWKPSTGIIGNNPDLKYTHSDLDADRSYFKMTDGSIIVTSGVEQTLTGAGKLINKYRDTTGNDSGEFYYIKLSENEPWAELLLTPDNLADGLGNLFKLAGIDLGKNIGRYVLSIEDIKILIDGKDFDGATVSKWQATGLILLAVVPGSKGFIPVSKLASNTIKWAIATIKVSGKETKLVFKVVSGVVTFGSRSKLAKIIAVKTGEEAHHIIPWAIRINNVIQKASKAGFHMNAKVNGIALKKYNKLIGEGLHGNHPAYNAFVNFRLNKFKGTSPEVAKAFLEKELIPDLLDYIDIAKKSGLNLNEYFKKVVNPPLGIF